MLIHDLTAEQCREVLARTNVARLGCARADQPYIVPIFFSFDAQDDRLYSFSTLGRKVDWMRGNGGEAQGRGRALLADRLPNPHEPRLGPAGRTRGRVAHPSE